MKHDEPFQKAFWCTIAAPAKGAWGSHSKKAWSWTRFAVTFLVFFLLFWLLVEVGGSLHT